MFKRLVYLFVIIVLFFLPSRVLFAGVVINQVQIETETNKDNEFIELYNNGSSEVDLTNFSLYKKTSGGTESNIVSKTRFENKKIPANGVLFLAREGKYSGTKTPDIFWPTSYSLAQNNSLILYKDFENKTIEHQVSWGEVSVFKLEINNSDNTDTSNTESTNNNENNSTGGSGSSTSSSSSYIKEIPKPKLKIITKNLGFVGKPVSILATIENEEYRNIYGKFYFNFGDGETKEISTLENGTFTHTYFYPGNYNISLEYYKSSYILEPDLYTELNIEIVKPSLVINQTGDENDFFIEIKNASNLDMDITNYSLKGKENIFIFPRNTIIKKDKSLILSPLISKMNFIDKNFLEILDPSGRVIYSQKIIGEVKGISTKKVSSSNKNFLPKNVESTSNDFGQDLVLEGEPLVNELIPYEEENKSVNNFTVIAIFVLFILGVVGFVYFIRSKSEANNSKDEEFEILDE